MKQAIYEHLYDLENTNIAIHYYTNRGSYFPAHWHPAIELIYILNGTAEILVGGVKHTLVPGEFIVIDSNQIHESQCALASMVVDVHVSRDFLESYIEEPVLPGIDCMRDTLKRNSFLIIWKYAVCSKNWFPCISSILLPWGLAVMRLLWKFFFICSITSPILSQPLRYQVLPKTRNGFRKSFYM